MNWSDRMSYEDHIKERYNEMFPTVAEKETVQLKLCPFCGGEAEIRVGYNHTYVRCSTPECYVRTRRYKTVEEAVESWNRRVNE